jgi:hypothetical protein
MYKLFVKPVEKNFSETWSWDETRKRKTEEAAIKFYKFWLEKWIPI